MSNPFDMNISLAGVDTSYPTLSVGDHLVQIITIEPKESGNTPGLWMAKVSLETLEPTHDAKGKSVEPGFKFSANVTLPGQPGVAPEVEEIRIKSLAAFVDAALGTDISNRPDFSQETADKMINKKLRAVFKKSKDDKFGETQCQSFKAIQTEGA